jgi:hypothetical protein
LSPFNGPSTFLPVSHPTEGPRVNDCLHSFYRPAPRMAPGNAATWNEPGLFGPCYSAFRIVGSISVTKAPLRDVRDRLLPSTVDSCSSLLGCRQDPEAAYGILRVRICMTRSQGLLPWFTSDMARPRCATITKKVEHIRVGGGSETVPERFP